MKIAVLSDIHGNYTALKECMDYAERQNIKIFIFLGDYVGELAYPQKTMELIYLAAEKYECYFIKGNKEDYWLDYKACGERGWKDKDSTTGSLLYAYRNLTRKDLGFFSRLNISDTLIFEPYPPITICHGSPKRVNEKMLENDSTYNAMDSNPADLILCGHTHIQGVIEHNGKKVRNPGSVGLSLRSGGKAQFMVLHGYKDGWEGEFVSLEYNVHRVMEELKESGLESAAPCWCEVTKHLLQTGEVSHGAVLGRAMKYCSEELGDCHWPDVPEKYWEMAVNEMI